MEHDREGQNELDALLEGEKSFPMPTEELLDLDFAFDFAGTDFLPEIQSQQDAPMDALVEQQYGAVAALATQGAVMRPVMSTPEQGLQQPFQQDWQLMQDKWNPSEPMPSFGHLQSQFPNTVASDHYRHMPQLVGGSLPGLDLAAVPPPVSQEPYFQSLPPFSAAPPLHQQLPPEQTWQFGGMSPPPEQGFPAPGTSPLAGLPPDPQAFPPPGSHSEPHSSEDARHESVNEPSGSGDSGPKGHQDDAEAKAERVKEKNKRAQKKFRQKQKEKQEELEKSAVELAARLKQTLAELDALQNQKTVLEIALTRHTAAAQPGPPAPAQPAEEQVFVPAKGSQQFSPKSGILLEVVFDPPRKLTREQALRLSLKDHARLWKEVCHQAKELLKNGAEEDENSPAGKKLRALLNERHGLLAWTSINNPVIMQKLMTCKLSDPPVPDPEAPSPDLWRQIMGSMSLTAQQKKDLLKARNTYLTEVGRLMEERSQLQAVLKNLGTEFKTGLADKARTHVLWAEAVRALQENVDALHICHCEFMITVFNRATGLTVSQEAKLLVQSFPHAPDVFALLKELAAVEGEPAAAELLKIGAQQQSPDSVPNFEDPPSLNAERAPYVPFEDKIQKVLGTSRLRNYIEELRE